MSNEATLLLYHEICQFLYREARLLDAGLFEEWFTLLTDDFQSSLWTRKNLENEHDPAAIEKNLPFVNTDKRTLDIRVQRLRTNYAHAEYPASRARHFINNIEIEAIADTPEIKAYVNFIIFRSRIDQEDTFHVGRREDILRKEGETWKVAKRKVIFDHNLFPGRNVSVFFAG